MNIYAIIVAGGTGTRMGNAVPKQFLPINDKPMLYYCLKAFVDAVAGVKLILVLHPDYISYANEALRLLQHDVLIVNGGATRFNSVKNGINAIADAAANDIVLVHDAARPCINYTLLTNLINNVQDADCAIPVWPIAESIRKQNGDGSNTAVDRNNLFSVQTPQTAPYKNMVKAFEQEYNASFTDEASVLEKAGFTIKLIEGLAQNIKVTTADQIYLAAHYLKTN